MNIIFNVCQVLSTQCHSIVHIASFMNGWMGLLYNSWLADRPVTTLSTQAFMARTCDTLLLHTLNDDRSGSSSPGRVSTYVHVSIIMASGQTTWASLTNISHQHHVDRLAGDDCLYWSSYCRPGMHQVLHLKRCSFNKVVRSCRHCCPACGSGLLHSITDPTAWLTLPPPPHSLPPPGLGVRVSGVWRGHRQPGAEEDGRHPEEHRHRRAP